MRHLALPAVLVLLAAAGGALALRADPAPGGTTAPGAHATPMLSPRRLPAVLARTVADANAQRALAAAFADPALGRAREESCLMVSEGDRHLFALREGVPLIPASNTKLLTAAAAIAGLGADGRLRTDVRAAVGRGGVVEGNLWLVGGGDPLLGTGDYAASFTRQPQVYTPIEELARRVAAAGVKEVRGAVVGDETRYDTQRYLPTWKSSYRTRHEIGPQSALTVNDNFSQWRPVRIAAARPAVHAAEVFTNLLRAHGVTVIGTPGEGRVPQDVPRVADILSPPMTEVAGQMLRESDNLTAELLVKELGLAATGRGTTADGLDAARDTLRRNGFPVEGLAPVDGSGLDRGNRATCAAIHATLRSAGPVSPLASGLAVAGESGTLATRLVDGPAAGRVRAKTGSLDGVSALSGFAATRTGVLTFALVLNALPRDSLANPVWERVTAALVAYPDAPHPDELAPR